MTFAELDAIRGYGIALILVGLALYGVALKARSVKHPRLIAWLPVIPPLLVCVGGLAVFVVLDFFHGWEEYWAAVRPVAGKPVEYHGPHIMAARVIRTLGEMDASSLGIVCGAVGLLFGAVFIKHLLVAVKK